MSIWDFQSLHQPSLVVRPWARTIFVSPSDILVVPHSPVASPVLHQARQSATEIGADPNVRNIDSSFVNDGVEVSGVGAVVPFGDSFKAASPGGIGDFDRDLKECADPGGGSGRGNTDLRAVLSSGGEIRVGYSWGSAVVSDQGHDDRHHCQ